MISHTVIYCFLNQHPEHLGPVSHKVNRNKNRPSKRTRKNVLPGDVKWAISIRYINHAIWLNKIP